MSDIILTKSTLTGRVTVPPSKSDVHRAIICASLAKGRSRIVPVVFSQDILATIDCIKALGAEVQLDGDGIIVDSQKMFSCEKAVLDCRESGSTVRFFIPLAAAGGVKARFIGHGGLPQRPLDIFEKLLPEHGVECITEGGLPFEISGRLKPGRYELTGSVSSQFVTGLLFALSLLEGDSVIHLTSPLQSKGYIDMTIDVMRRFGVNAEIQNGDYHIKGGQNFMPCDYKTEGDWSQAAFCRVGGAISGDVTVDGVREDSYQGDKEIVSLLKRFGAEIISESGRVTCRKAQLHGIEIDASQIPDLVPILSVCGAFARGTTHIYNAQRVRLKESDRLLAMCEDLSSCGVNISQTDDGLLIEGREALLSGKAEGFNDHRIVMSMAIAALRSTGEIVITNRESISKSYPAFFEDYFSLTASGGQPPKGGY